MSRSFSSASSVLEESDLEQQQNGAAGESNVYYEDEQFDSQSEDRGESVVAAAPPAVLTSSGSDSYGSDEFEDEQAAHSVAPFEEVSVSGDAETSGDYDDESFEGEEEAAALELQRPEQGDVSQVTEEGNEYVDESFEGEEATTDEQEDAAALGVQGGTCTSQASDEDNYYDDESFEGQETTGEHEVATVVGAQGAQQGDSSQATDEANDYDDESFEGEEATEELQVEAATSLGVHADISQAISDEHYFDDESFEGGETTDVQNDETQQEGTPPDVQDVPGTELYPELRDWCFKKIHELRRAKPSPENSRPPVREPRNTVGKLPAAAVKELIHRVSSGRQRGHHRQQGGNSQFLSLQKLKLPTSLMERAQTQQLLAKGSHSHEPPPAPPQPAASTFYSVKCDVLRGRLATMRLSDAADSGDFSLETLAWVQKVAAKQRQVANHAAGDLGARRLYDSYDEVEMATRLQLEDSIALRKQTAQRYLFTSSSN